MRKREPVSTEGRIFAARLARDLKDREKLGANAISPGTTTWKEATTSFIQRIDHKDTVTRRMAILRGVSQRLNAIPEDKRGFHIVVDDVGSDKKGALMFVTMAYDLHPLVSIENEMGIALRRHCFDLTQRVHDERMVNGRIFTKKGRKFEALTDVELVYISDHALGRLGERAAKSVTSYVLNALRWASVVATIVVGDERHWENELSFVIGDVMLAGVVVPSLKTIDSTSERQRTAYMPYWDIRTVIPAQVYNGGGKPPAALQAEAVEVARAAWVAAGHCPKREEKAAMATLEAAIRAVPVVKATRTNNLTRRLP